MAHDRSARFGKLITQTPPAVGPGIYDVYEPSKPPRDLHQAYPFLKGAARCTLEMTKNAGALPGPGSYDPVEPRRHVPERILGGVSIDFTDIRLKPKIYDGPGPQSYNLSDDLFKIGSRKSRSHPGTWRGPAGNLRLGKPPRSIIADTIVSVPTKRDANGYDIRGGILVKNPPCEFEPTNFYDVPRGEANFTTLKYKGNFWSLMSGRDDKENTETPGPGAYDREKPIDLSKMRDEKYRSMKKIMSRQSRYLDKLWRTKLLENYPAPNAYDPPRGPFEKNSACDCDEYTVEPAAFGHRAERFLAKAPDVIPGPGAYDPADAKCASCSKVCAPFGALAARFRRRSCDSPGPGLYDLTKDDLAKRIFTICKRSYARPSMPLRLEGSSGSIRHEDAASECGVTPDPRAKKSRVHHAVFKSRTTRFKDARPRADAPCPGHYDPMTAFKASRDPCHFARRCLTTPFASRTLRFPKVPDGVDLQVPGPGIYDLRGDFLQDVKGGVVGDATECRKSSDCTPGPQRYCFHPYIGSSVVRRTYNVTLGKPKILQGEEKPEKPWMRRCHPGRKILRCFVQPTSKQELCSIRRFD